LGLCGRLCGGRGEWNFTKIQETLFCNNACVFLSLSHCVAMRTPDALLLLLLLFFFGPAIRSQISKEEVEDEDEDTNKYEYDDEKEMKMKMKMNMEMEMEMNRRMRMENI
jgi:hypothetical protein